MLDELDVDSLRALTVNALRYESDPNVLMSWYVDWPGARVRDWWDAYRAARTGPDSSAWARPTVYAHPFIDPAGRTVIQYWYFYPFNDFMGNHEGDWEHVNVVVDETRSRVEEVHYYFHHRSVTLPQGTYLPEITDGTHPVVYVGGRMYNVLDFPIRLLAGEHNEGSHGSYPFPGEWESAAALGSPESVQKADDDSTRVFRHDTFDVILTPEPGRIDYLGSPQVLREWIAFLLPLRWGFPSAPSVGSGIVNSDVGNRAPFGPAYNAAWNRTAPGMNYSAYRLRKLSVVRSVIEDLLQPWYYLYIFRTPRYIHDADAAGDREQLERLGLAPRSGVAERGFGSPNLGLHVGFPTGDFDGVVNRSTGLFVWRNLWAKIRFGAFEILGGYQRFSRSEPPGGAQFVYPFTANLVLRGPEARIRPYGTIGGGAYGWESRIRTEPGGPQLVQSGWDLGWTASLGIEYYLRSKVALDIALRYHATGGPGPDAGIDDGRMRFFALWVGHYLRF